jgi:hypothetical protein
VASKAYFDRGAHVLHNKHRVILRTVPLCKLEDGYLAVIAIHKLVAAYLTGKKVMLR